MKALILLFLFSHLSFSPSSILVADSQFEGYDDEINEDDDDYSSPPLPTRTRPFLTTASQPHSPSSLDPSLPEPDPNPIPDSDSPCIDLPKPFFTSFEYWDEDNSNASPSNPRNQNCEYLLRFRFQTLRRSQAPRHSEILSCVDRVRRVPTKGFW